eukprot:CAMPEP_0172698252 /NCGR_PEP_ID=MMETSP1074-20121228/29340_1 /TAXON_ID=2916 /ORGANISM="Ceratium fusus, Strain PA161109" /LENGTH=80 /DNA_ID=CAMNT_0013519265 /DNA_START=278 /DNA_END=517 /DNA_ORIENTATION=+
MAVVQGMGQLVSTSVILAKESPQSKDESWLSKLGYLGINARIVPAQDGSLELVAEAAEMVTESKVDAIALAVESGGFEFL